MRSSLARLIGWTCVAALAACASAPEDDYAQLAVARAALSTSDRDGDGVLDGSDNCPTLANPDQLNSNGAGPGDACELALVFGTNPGTEFARFQSEKELVVARAPFALSGTPDLLRVTATAPAGSSVHYSSKITLLGVKSPFETQGGDGETVQPGEELTIAIGSDSVLGAGRAIALGVQLMGQGTAVLTLLDGATQVAQRTLPVNGAWRTTLAASGVSFDRFTLRVTSGRVGIKALHDALYFTLDQITQSCPVGYARVDAECVDIDECSGPRHVCDPLVTCANTQGSFECGACPEGYEGSGAQACIDIDECALGIDDCSEMVTCGNTTGGHQCGECPAGYEGDGHSCADIDECELGTHNCDEVVTCLNTEGGFACGDCAGGYTGDGFDCVDVDECAAGFASCDALVACTNTPGTYECGACPEGYTGDGFDCVDADECALGHDDCSPLVTCANTLGGYACGECPSGYEGDGFDCSDVDECALDLHACNSNTVCVNTAGSYTCGACPSGFAAELGTCTDIDECSTMRPCDYYAACTNTEGSYVCGACPPGYTGDGYTGCMDTDECAAGTHSCGAHATCSNTHGGFDCVPWLAVCELAPETCDGFDNDRDGNVDEGTGGRPCGTDVGACQAGVEVCDSGVLRCVGSIAYTVERCGNDIDENCDGTVSRVNCLSVSNDFLAIGQQLTQADGRYLQAESVATSLAHTDLTLTGPFIIMVHDNVDLSYSTTLQSATQGSLTLSARSIELHGDIRIGAGSITFDAGQLVILDGRLLAADGSLLPPNRVLGNPGHVMVSNEGDLQQALDLVGDDGIVQVGMGRHRGNFVVSRSVRLLSSSDSPSEPVSASNPELMGTIAGGTLLRGDGFANIDVQGLRFSDNVDCNPSHASARGVELSNVSGRASVFHNAFHGFTDAAVHISDSYIAEVNSCEFYAPSETPFVFENVSYSGDYENTVVE